MVQDSHIHRTVWLFHSSKKSLLMLVDRSSFAAVSLQPSFARLLQWVAAGSVARTAGLAGGRSICGACNLKF